MIKTAALLIPVAQVKATREVEKARQDKLGHGAPVGEPARGGHQNVGPPKIGLQEIARSRGKLMDPFQARRARP